MREAQALAQLQHPNVVAVHDVGVAEGRVFIAMELVDGVTLDAPGDPAAARWREIVELFVQAGRGLAAAHAAGMVHRDFKPGNVLVDRDGRVRVIDFGLARRLGRRTSTSPSARPPRSDDRRAVANATTRGAGATVDLERRRSPRRR